MFSHYCLYVCIKHVNKYSTIVDASSIKVSLLYLWNNAVLIFYICTEELEECRRAPSSKRHHGKSNHFDLLPRHNGRYPSPVSCLNSPSSASSPPQKKKKKQYMLTKSNPNHHLSNNRPDECLEMAYLYLNKYKRFQSSSSASSSPSQPDPLDDAVRLSLSLKPRNPLAKKVRKKNTIFCLVFFFYFLLFFFFLFVVVLEEE